MFGEMHHYGMKIRLNPIVTSAVSISSQKERGAAPLFLEKSLFSHITRGNLLSQATTNQEKRQTHREKGLPQPLLAKQNYAMI